MAKKKSPVEHLLGRAEKEEKGGKEKEGNLGLTELDKPLGFETGDLYVFPFLKGKAPEMIILSNSITSESTLVYFTSILTPRALRLTANTSLLQRTLTGRDLLIFSQKLVYPPLKRRI